MPVPGFSTFQLDRNSAAQCVCEAITHGYRHFDCAEVHGNEKEVGIGLRKGMEEAGLNRKDIFITSKCWCTSKQAQDCQLACIASITALGCGYLDVYYVHWPQAFQPVTNASSCLGSDLVGGYALPDRPRHFFPASEGNILGNDGRPGTCLGRVPFIETWLALEALHSQGLVRDLGVTDFTAAQLEELLPLTRVRPSIVQIEMHVYLQQKDFVAFCDKHQLLLCAYGTLMGANGQKDYQQITKELAVKEVAKKHSMTFAQVLFSFVFSRGAVPIISSTSVEHLKENLCFALLDDEDLRALGKLDRGIRWAKTPCYGVPTHFPVK